MGKRFIALMAMTTILGLSQKAAASGFALIEQSVSSMGNAYAGGAAIAEDATTIFFNPAGITRLCGGQFIGGIHVILPSAKFRNDNSIINPAVGSGTVQPLNFEVPFFIEGNNGKDGGENAAVAHAYYSMQLNEALWLGLAVTTPFGLVTDYDNDWVGRYYALRSSLLTIDINPVIAYKINRCWSVGGGFRALYAHAKLSNEIDYGTIAWLAVVNPDNPIAQSGLNMIPENLGGPFLPQEQDGRAHLKGNAWGYGGNIGILFEPRCGTRFGVNWRSQIKLKIDGSERFSRTPLLIERPEILLGTPLEGLIPLFEGIQNSAAINTRAKTDVNLPDLFQISAYHEINRFWAIMADISWTRWKLLERIRFRFNNEAQPDGIITLKWQNSMRYSIGTTFTPPCSGWKLRSGIAYDQTPVKNKELQTPRIPDEDRFWLAFGAGYDLNRCLHFDVGYAHLFVRDPKIDKTDFFLDEDVTRGGLRGKYDARTDIVSAQFVWKF